MVLVLFGILVRLVLWPLNQKAMRSTMAMQAIQPELKAIQDKYKEDPAKLQQEMFKLYKEHGVNPLGGCWPMLLPMPVLLALFFVFQNTIELRGQAFLWLPDLSRPDPLYIIPVIMGLSMFGLTHMGQRGHAAEPADEDDDVRDAGDDDGAVPEFRVGAQPVLRGEQPGEHPAAVAHQRGADEAERAAERRGGEEAGRRREAEAKKRKEGVAEWRTINPANAGVRVAGIPVLAPAD